MDGGLSCRPPRWPGSGPVHRRSSSLSLKRTTCLASSPLRTCDPSVSMMKGSPSRRAAAIARSRSATLEWLMLVRTKSTPRARSARSAAGPSVAGPSVTTILVFLRLMVLPSRGEAPPPGSVSSNGNGRPRRYFRGLLGRSCYNLLDSLGRPARQQVPPFRKDKCKPIAGNQRCENGNHHQDDKETLTDDPQI